MLNAQGRGGRRISAERALRGPSERQRESICGSSDRPVPPAIYISFGARPILFDKGNDIACGKAFSMSWFPLLLPAIPA